MINGIKNLTLILLLAFTTLSENTSLAFVYSDDDDDEEALLIEAKAGVSQKVRPAGKSNKYFNPNCYCSISGREITVYCDGVGTAQVLESNSAAQEYASIIRCPVR